jgi:hypothetical protein
MAENGPLARLVGMEELDSRRSGSFEVALVWNRRTNGVTVVVRDDADGTEHRVAVDAEHALDAFHHPFAYLTAA